MNVDRMFLSPEEKYLEKTEIRKIYFSCRFGELCTLFFGFLEGFRQKPALYVRLIATGAERKLPRNIFERFGTQK